MEAELLSPLLARAEVVPRLALTVFIRPPLADHLAGVASVIERALSLPSAGGIDKYRLGRRGAWQPLPQRPWSTRDLLSEPELLGAGPDNWSIELRGEGGAHLEFAERLPYRGIDRLSHFRVVFEPEPGMSEVIALAQHVAEVVPVWWGSAGWVFDHVSGDLATAGRRVAALAKRYWSIQIQDIALLQWQACRGMPGTGWLTLLGEAFVQSMSLDVDSLSRQAAALAPARVFSRRCGSCLLIAAGPEPSMGDIHAADDLGPQVQVSKMLEPLLLKAYPGFAGPLARPDVMVAWLDRFREPDAWLAAEIGD